VKLHIHPAALRELQDAAAFYLSHTNPRLSHALVLEFERISRLLLVNPLLGTPHKNNLRHIPLRRFPYTVCYRTAGDQIQIIAVAHQRRKAGYWLGRIS